MGVLRICAVTNWVSQSVSQVCRGRCTGVIFSCACLVRSSNSEAIWVYCFFFESAQFGLLFFCFAHVRGNLGFFFFCLPSSTFSSFVLRICAATSWVSQCFPSL